MPRFADQPGQLLASPQPIDPEDLDQLKEALRQAEDKYRVLVENANDAIFVLQEGRIRFANPKALELGGILAEDLEKVPFTEYLHPDEKELVVQRHEKRLQGEKVLNMYPLRIVTRRGETFWAEVNAVKIVWENRPATLNIIRDITSQKLIEQHYLQTESLATLRTLSGGMAHSINNLLMGIQGRLSLLLCGRPPDDDSMEHLKVIEACVEDAAKLTRQMLGFAQTGKYNVVRLDLNELVAEVAGGLARGASQVDLSLQAEPDLWPVKGDRQQLEMAVTNVLLNALQAIPRQGSVFIRTENFELSEGRDHHVSIKPLKDIRPGRLVRLTCRDTGVGMDETVRKRVFEPFFTTKGFGRHRGLGLSCVYGVVANHDGMVDIETVPGSGTTVRIYLPAALPD